MQQFDLQFIGIVIGLTYEHMNTLGSRDIQHKLAKALYKSIQVVKSNEFTIRIWLKVHLAVKIKRSKAKIFTGTANVL